MSLESIYKFVEKPEPEPPKKIRYRSKYDPNGPLIGSTFGNHGTTVVDGKGFHALKQNHVVTSSFGVKKENSTPKSFLRKGSRDSRSSVIRPTIDRETKRKEQHKPPVPSRKEKPVLGLKTDKNFVHCNAVEVINSAPKKLEDRTNIHHDEYGKPPSYLQEVNAAIAREKEIVERYVAEQCGYLTKEESDELMDETERSELIKKLKQKWDEVNSVYQKYCHKSVLDTPGEIKRKATQEAELAKLEEYIEKLSRPGPLVIKK
mmetsp:Transcript_11591/g.24457  ORF Transcript_11591/g.24457 Transcript_11591/m.24457 type:complete len:261 (-) Transcript_11591:106-888(-)